MPYRKRFRVRASPPTLLPEEVSVNVRPMPELSGDTCEGENEPGPGALPLSTHAPPNTIAPRSSARCTSVSVRPAETPSPSALEARATA